MLGSSRPSCSNPTSASLRPFPSSETWNQSLSGVLCYRAAGRWGKCLHHPLPLCVHGSHPKISGGEFIRPLLSFKMNLICTAQTKPHLSLPVKVTRIQPRDVKQVCPVLTKIWDKLLLGQTKINSHHSPRCNTAKSLLLSWLESLFVRVVLLWNIQYDAMIHHTAPLTIHSDL